MPTRHFLSSPQGLSQQVADRLAADEKAGRFTLAKTLLVTPTAGAARQVNRRLKALGLKPPVVAQPMQAMLPKEANTASPVERCLAWSAVIQNGSRDALQALFWRSAPETAAELLKAGKKFCQLCDQLAEAALSPETFELPERLAGSFDEARWHAISQIYVDYKACLKDWGLLDPNEQRLEQIHAPKYAFQRIVFAGVPDLPTAASRYGLSLEQHGVSVDVLIWNPGRAAETDFDEWGRPLAPLWNKRPLAFEADQIQVAASARDEARLVAQALAKTPSGAAGLVLADPSLQTSVSGELLSHGRRPYRPEGDMLIRCEAAVLALEWEEFRGSLDLRRLRRLLELPAFCRALDEDNSFSQTKALIAIDQLLGLSIAGTLEGARAATASSDIMPAFRSDELVPVRDLIARVQSCLKLSSLDLIKRAFPDEEARPETAHAVLEIGEQLQASAAVQNWSRRKGDSALPAQIFAQALRAAQVQAPAEAEDIVLNGWLEAAWLPESKLHIAGMIDGAVPQSMDGDPFLPDSIRPDLGLSHNEQRQARDAYLLHCLIASRERNDLTVSFSKYNPAGDPNRPSRLLLRTPPKLLPERVRYVLHPKVSLRERPKRQTDWRWKLPKELPGAKRISPTQFKSYLECPFRFYLEKVLRLETGPLAAQEMDAAVFGNIIHKALESFGLRAMDLGEKMLNLGEQEIRRWVQEELDTEARRQFGPKPAPAVQVQLANAASRLNAFARVQADCFAEGWAILKVEEKLSADADTPLMVGPLPLSGMIDRIEKNIHSGALRILDYKTFSSVKKPEKTHLGPISRSWLPGAEVQIGNKQQAWADLQLPLYRRILEHWYPEESAAHLPEVAYFVLPSDPGESGIFRFAELNDASLYESACSCAEKVATSIADGIFWPPQPFRGSWDDPLAALFVNGSPEKCIDSKTIARLKGGRR